MIGTTLSSLVRTIEEGSVPAWVHDYVQVHREEIITALRDKGYYTIRHEESGQEIHIKVEGT